VNMPPRKQKKQRSRRREQGHVHINHLARIIAMQALFESDLNGTDPVLALEQFLEASSLHGATETDLDIPSLDPLIRDGADRAAAAAFARHLVAGVSTHQPTIDQQLRETAPAWPLEQMAGVDKAVLRLAMFELIVDNKTPLRAVINEAVELAKAYGGEHSSRFVNGVLGSIASQVQARAAQ